MSSFTACFCHPTEQVVVFNTSLIQFMLNTKRVMNNWIMPIVIVYYRSLFGFNMTLVPKYKTYLLAQLALSQTRNVSRVTEDKRHIRSCDRTKKLVGIMFVLGYFIFIVTKVNGWR